MECLSKINRRSWIFAKNKGRYRHIGKFSHTIYLHFSIKTLQTASAHREALIRGSSLKIIHIVVALIHEAKPLITHYQLRTLADKHPFAIYGNDTITLIVSGVGKLSSAASVGYLQALNRKNGLVAWLNIGIAGHQQGEIGQGFISHRIEDDASGRVYYPPQVLSFGIRSSDLITVDYVEKNYTQNSAYDMEASGFYNAAIRSTTAEFIQSYKIISDHRKAPIAKITKTLVTGLIEGCMDEIKLLIETLTSAINPYRQIHATPLQFDELIQRWHFTETQKIQVKQLLQRIQVLFGDRLPPRMHPTSHVNAKTFLKTLSETLATHQLHF